MTDELNEEKSFLAEVETMDLSPIREKTFGVAVATGNPKGGKFLCTTIHGPYSFVEMVEQVGEMWMREQHHAKAIVLKKDMKEKVEILDENTIDYIEAKYQDILMEEALAGAFDIKEFTCVAGFVEEEGTEKADPPTP